MNLRQVLAAVAFRPLSLVSENAKARLRQSRLFPAFSRVYGWLGEVLGPGLYTIQGGPAKGLKIWVEPGLRRGYLAGLYEPAMTRAIQEHCRSGMIVCDVGAHNGYFTLVMSRSVGASGLCVAFEPNEDNAERLRLTVRANDLTNVRIEELGIGAEDGEASFLVHDLSSMGRLDSLVATSDRGAFVAEKRIRVQTLDSYIAAADLARVDFVKLDIEGAELLAIQGARGVLQRDRPVLLIEVHSFEPPERNARPVVDSLRQLGYTVLDVETGEQVSATSFGGGAVVAIPSVRFGSDQDQASA